MIQRLLLLIVLLILPLFLFLPILSGYIPFPGAFHVAWYEPWKSDTAVDGAPQIPHKPFGDDIFRQIYPFKYLALSQLRQGVLPLWNPWNGNGQPLLATMHTGILHPFHTLLLAIDPIGGWTLIVFLQFPFVGLGLYLYLRSLKHSSIAVYIGIIIFLFSGVFVVRSLYTDYIWAIGVLPYLLWIIEQEHRRYLPFLPFFIALLIFSVQPQIIVYICIVLFAYTLYRFSWRSWQLQHLTLCTLMGIGLGSIQLLPTTELYLHANVTPDASKVFVTNFLVPIQFLISIVIPNFFGNVGTYNFWGPMDYVETVASLGSIPIVLVLVSLLHGKFLKRDIRLFWFLTVVLTIILTIQSPVTLWLYSLPIPILATSIPSRLFLITTFALSILTTYGVDILISRSVKKTQIFISVGLVGVFLVIVLLVTGTLFARHTPCEIGLIQTCFQVGLRNALVESGIFIFGSIAIFYIISVSHRKTVGSLSIFVLISMIGIYNGKKILPFAPASQMYPPHKVISELQSITTNTRMTEGDTKLYTDFASYYRYRDPNYYDPLYIKRYGELFSYAKTKSKTEALSRSTVEISILTKEIQTRRQRLLELTSTGIQLFQKQSPLASTSGDLLYTDDHFILTQTPVLPRFSLLYNTEVISSDDDILARLFDPSFNPFKQVIVEKQINLHSLPHTKGSITILKENSMEVTMMVETQEPAMLLQTDTYYPGWKAFIDATETELFRANYTFRAVYIPSGRHTVTIRYNPLSFYIGASISGITAIVSLILVLHSFPVRKRIFSKRRKEKDSQR